MHKKEDRRLHSQKVQKQGQERREKTQRLRKKQEDNLQRAGERQLLDRFYSLPRGHAHWACVREKRPLQMNAVSEKTCTETFVSTGIPGLAVCKIDR